MKRIRGMIKEFGARLLGLYRLGTVPLDAKSAGRENDLKSVGDFLRLALREYAIVSGYWPPEMFMLRMEENYHPLRFSRHLRITCPEPAMIFLTSPRKCNRITLTESYARVGLSG